MFYKIAFERPFRGHADAEVRVHRAAARVVATAAEMGIRAKDISVGEDLIIAHEGMLDVGGFIEMVYQHVDAVTDEIIQ